MTKVLQTPAFMRSLKKYVKKNAVRAELVIDTLNKFRLNPQNKGLKLEKLSGLDTWTIRVTQGDRIFFTWVNADTVLLLDIGKHDKYRTIS